MQNVVPSHLADSSLFDFKHLNAGDPVIAGGDLAFDRETLPVIPADWQNDADDERQPLFHERVPVTEIK